MSDNNFIVYEHINKTNGKRYIGITSQPLSRRWRKNGAGYKSCVLFYRAIQKYGWDNFEHNILYQGLSKQEAQQKEKEIIAKYQSNNPEFGYNLLSGGEHGFHSELSKEKNRQAHLGKKIIYSEETKERVRLERKQRWANMSPEKRRYVLRGILNSKKNLGKRNLGNIRSVICVETGQVFASIADAEEWLGHDRDAYMIGCVLNGKRKTTGGYHWQYFDKSQGEGE